MNTEELREAINGQDFQTFKEDLLSRLYDIKYDVIRAMSDTKYAHQAHTKLKKTIEFLDSRDTFENVLKTACEMYVKKELNDATERNI